mmetsp:Transcript_56195/g.168233  ORF Transcript_56195/g.168233 Transcript_56195/m.168233 type:complete len:290 (-) Transcript_56195:1634-2503(-)
MQDQIDFSSPSTYIRIESDDEDDGDIIDDGGYDSNSICPSSTSSGVVVARGSAPPDETEEFLRAARARLHPLNVLNVAAFGANVFVSLGIGIWGLGGVMSSVREVTKSHMTLLTPAAWTSELIWAPIFFFEGIFCAAQLLPTFRGRPIVLEGVGYFFVYACAAQIAWTFFFSFCLFLPAFISMVILLVSLSCLLVSQFLAKSPDESRREYWLLRFPFSLHMGWIFVSTAINWSVLSLETGASESTLLAGIIASMALLLVVAFLFMSAMTKNLVVPAVIIWSFVSPISFR